MKYIAVCFLFLSCQYTKPKVKQSVNEQFVTMTIDSCEYLVSIPDISLTGVHMITHKGNCKFCLERNKKLFGKRE